MSSLMYRQKMITALEATGADGASIAGTESEVSITLTFKREVSNGCSDGSACCRSALVASEGKPLGDNELRGRSMELPQSDTEVAPARRMWMDRTSDRLFTAPVPYAYPVTILPGHSAVEEIEREAYERGLRDGQLAEREKWVYDHTPKSIDGVSPVVVDAWTFDDGETWTHVDCARVVSAWAKQGGSCNTPCRVHLYPGIGPDGKRAGGRE